MPAAERVLRPAGGVRGTAGVVPRWIGGVRGTARVVPRRIGTWLFAPGDPRRLAAVRVGLCALLAARLASGPYPELATQPEALFRPISFLRLLERMPSPEAVAVLQSFALGAAVLATVGLLTRYTLPLAWLAALPLVAMTSSLGKVVHNDVLLLLCLVPLLPSPAGAAWSLDARQRPVAARGPAFGWPVRTAMVVVAGAYFFSGLGKLLHAGPAWVLSDNVRWVLYASSDVQPTPNPFALFVADRPLLAHLVAAATLAVELGFPLVLWRPRLAWLFVPAVVAMHAGIGLAMHLDYSAMAATVVVVLVDWAALADRLRRPRPASPGRSGPVPAEERR